MRVFFFHNSFSETLESHYFGYAWILFWCTGIVVSGSWGVFVPSAALQKQLLV